MSVIRGSLGGVFFASLAAVVAAVLVATGMVGSLSAQDNAALVKGRQDLMKQMGRAFRPVMPIVKGESSNLADALESTKTWNANAKRIIDNFPAGTGREAVPETRAKPEVWSERAEFEKAAEKLATESAKLLAAATSDDLEGFRAQFKEFGQACGGCHEARGGDGGKFRYPKE